MFFFFRVRLSWNIGNNRKLFVKLNSKLGLYHVVLTTPKTSPQKVSVTVVEMQQLPDIEKADSENEVFCLKWRNYSGRRKIYVNFKTDIENLNIVVYRYRNILCLKVSEIHLKLTEHHLLLAKRVCISSYIEIFYKRCFVVDETTVHN